jgi:hypothetical protein
LKPKPKSIPMKTTTNCIVIAMFALTLLWVTTCNLNAQTLLIKGNVTLDEVSSFEKYSVKVLDMSNDSTITFDAVKKFTCKLNYNRIYMVVISKKGYESKSVYIDTKCSINESFKFVFDMNLVHKKVNDMYVIQAGGIFYNKNKRTFDYFYN